jgi:hypothetical protein
MPDYAPRICIDFDGVLHSYSSGWQGATVIPDPPTDGAQAFVACMLGAGWEVVVCSTRAEEHDGRAAIRGWLARHGFPDLDVSHGKPPALVYLDDRAMRFDGAWPNLADVTAAGVPWTKR